MGISCTLGVAFEHWVEDESPAFIGVPHKADFDAFMTVHLYYEILLVLCDSFLSVMSKTITISCKTVTIATIYTQHNTINMDRCMLTK